MIYTYSQLKGIIKVGDKVRAVEGVFNPCSNLYYGKVGTITSIGGGTVDNSFWINGCHHKYTEVGYIEIIDRIPTWDTLEKDDVILSYGYEYRIIFRSCEFVSITNQHDECLVYTIKELKKLGYTIKTPSGGTISLEKIRTLWNAISDEKPLEIVELTIPQIAQKFNLKDEQVRIKE